MEHCWALPLPLAIRDCMVSYRQPARENSSRPVPFLPILDGFACGHCTGSDSWYSTNRKAVQEHINQVHRLFGTAGTAGLRPAKLQTWYSSNRAQYWEVAPAPVTAAATTTPATTATATASAGATATPLFSTRATLPSAAVAPPRAACTRPLAPAPASSPAVTIDLTTADRLEEVEEEIGRAHV